MSDREFTTPRSAGRPSPTGRGSIAGFVALVLTLAGLQTLPSLLERLGATSPAWLDPTARVLGGGFAPLWAMLIVGAWTIGPHGMRQLLRQSLRVRVSLKLYFAALVVPVAVISLAVLVGGTRPGGVDAKPLALVSQILIIAPVFALAEQLGLRAWLQRSLQAQVSPMVAGVLVGLVWVGHHLPLFAPDSRTPWTVMFAW